MLSAEEQTHAAGLPMTSEPSLGANTSKVLDNGGSNITLVHSPYENLGIQPKRMSDFKSHDEYLMFKQGTDPQSQRIRQEYLRRNKLNQKLYNSPRSRYR